MLILIQAAALAACMPPAHAVTKSPELCAAAAIPILGGYRAVDPSDEGVQAAGAFAANALGGELASVDSAEQQSVAGTNYRLELSLSSGARYRVVVYRSLQGEMSLTSQEQLSGGEEEADHGSNDGSDQSDPQR